jgi:2-amino-4-hydroxy-6-hydroxymethyldihydropteridine diphosphokinase
MMLDAFIGLGSNLEDRLAELRRAVEKLAELGRVRARSAVYETVAKNAAVRPFLNAALWLETALSPHELLSRLRCVEARAGGAGEIEPKKAARPLSLDVLLLGSRGDVVLVDSELTVPHPRLHLRAFALRPLLDLAPALVHPALSLPLGVLYRLLPAESSQPRPAGWL